MLTDPIPVQRFLSRARGPYLDRRPRPSEAEAWVLVPPQPPLNVKKRNRVKVGDRGDFSPSRPLQPRSRAAFFARTSRGVLRLRSLLVRPAGLKTRQGQRFCRPFTQQVAGVARQVRPPIDMPRGPADLHGVDARSIPDAEVEPGIVGRLIAAPAEALGNLTMAPGDERDRAPTPSRLDLELLRGEMSRNARGARCGCEA